MPPDAVQDEAREWLQKAELDLRAAELLTQSDPMLAGTALYHCQQAVEKAIKGFLVTRGQIFRKTHSIAEIGSLAMTLDPTLEPLVQQSTPLSDYAWKFRYPGGPPRPKPEEVERALTCAREVVRAIADRVSIRPE